MDIFNIITRDAEKIFKFKIISYRKICGGWLNLKWHIITDRGDFLIKQFSNQRYTSEKISIVEKALQRQKILYYKGIKCPFIYSYSNKIIQSPKPNIWYMLMEFCNGHLESADTISNKQMCRLGEMCGLMHKYFSGISIENEVFHFKNYPKVLCDNYESRLNEAEKLNLSQYIKVVKKQKIIIDSIDDGFFINILKGFTHSDFAVDNILFDVNGDITILDFDTNCYSYQYQDIGRAIMSFTYNNRRINESLINEFVNGYNLILPLTILDAIKALRFLWTVEVTWWIRSSVFIKDESPKVKRFAEELMWLTDNWFDLENQIL
jgi:homoserine kinase type II